MCATATIAGTLSTEDTSVRQEKRLANGSATSREAIRCGACKLNQFMTRNGSCRRCKVEFVAKPAEISAPVPTGPTWKKPVIIVRNLPERVALALRLLRMASGLSQVEVQRITGHPRQKLSAFEHGRHTPTIATATKFAEAMGSNMYTLMRLVEALA